LYWGIFGLASGVSPKLYSSRPRNPATTIASAWPALDTISLNTTSSQINSVLNGNYGYRVLDATANSSVAAFQANAGNTSSYNYQVATPGATDFGSTPQTTAGGVTYGGVVGTQDLWPAETLNGIYSPQGSGGYSTGALLAATLTTTLGPDAYTGKYLDPDTQAYQYLYPNASAGYYIGYLTPSDANSRVIGGNVPLANRGIALSYNGVALTNSNIQNGRYTAWVYNRILKPQSGLTGLQLTFANALRDRITNFDATAGGGLKNDATFLVKRSSDGGLVTPK